MDVYGMEGLAGLQREWDRHVASGKKLKCLATNH
jgi:hypothetical protein